jgi:hypothetical protein
LGVSEVFAFITRQGAPFYKAPQVALKDPSFAFNITPLMQIIEDVGGDLLALNKNKNQSSNANDSSIKLRAGLKDIANNTLIWSREANAVGRIFDITNDVDNRFWLVKIIFVSQKEFNLIDKKEALRLLNQTEVVDRCSTTSDSNADCIELYNNLIKYSTGNVEKLVNAVLSSDKFKECDKKNANSHKVFSQVLKQECDELESLTEKELMKVGESFRQYDDYL